MNHLQPICPPNLSARLFRLIVERMIRAAPSVLFRAWTEQIDHWFAAPRSALMKGEVNAVFFWETQFEDKRSPHYGRFLKLERDQLIELTWLTRPGGTKGAETVVTVELTPAGTGTDSPMQAFWTRNREISMNRHGRSFMLLVCPAGWPWQEAARTAAASPGIRLAAYRVGAGGDLPDLENGWQTKMVSKLRARCWSGPMALWPSAPAQGHKALSKSWHRCSRPSCAGLFP